MSMDVEARERRSIAKKKSGFEKWLDDPMVRMGVSMIPAGDRADALKMLLQSAFDAGFGCGCGDVVGEMLESFLKNQSRPQSTARD